MDINKYIENTKKKTKKAKLPALSTLTPIMPDGAAGIPSFNASFGSGTMSEELTNSDVNNIQNEITSETYDFLIDKGFKEDELDKVVSFEFEESEYVFHVKITANLTISSLRELADTLYPVVEKYDEDAYFDISTSSSISVDIDMGKTITEKLNRLDKKGMRVYSENYDLEALYESAKTKLDNNDKAKLKRFLQTTNDPEEVNTYMKGLLLDEDVDDGDTPSGTDYEAILNEIQNAYDELTAWVSRLTSEANRDGNDTIRMYADSLGVSLDDIRSELGDIWEAVGELPYERKMKENDPQKYVNMFEENYQTEEEFEDATGLEYKEYNIWDVIFDWVIDDIGDDTDKDRMVAEEIAQEATNIILGR